MQLDQPLDVYAVTDHGVYSGTRLVVAYLVWRVG
jgi:hypothetical protein